MRGLDLKKTAKVDEIKPLVTEAGELKNILSTIIAKSE